MTSLEDRVTKIESDVAYIKEDIRDTKADMRETQGEIKAINTVNNDFNLKLEKVAIALDANVKSTIELTDFMKKQQQRGNIAFGKVGWLIIGAIVSGIIGLIFRLI